VAAGEPRSRSREIYRGKVVHLFVDTVTLPNGHTTTLERIRHPGAAAVVPFVDPATILLVRQYRHAAGGYLLEIPAGKLDPGETPEHCAARETEEETAHRAGRLVRMGAILTTPGFTDEVIHLFAGFDLVRTESALEADEDLTVVPLPFADALARVERGEIQDAKTMSALLLAARRWPAGPPAGSAAGPTGSS
jgi:ADP-ribose pyrophosphatase